MPPTEDTADQTQSPPPSDQPAKPPTVAKRWRGLGLLTGALVTDSDESKLVTALFPTLRSALALPTSALGVLVAAGQLINIVFGPFWTWLARRTNRKMVLVVCSGMWGVWSIATGFAQDFTQLLVLYTIVIAGFAGAQPIISEMLADMFDDERRGRATGYLYGAIALFTAVVGPLLGQLSRIEDGWRYGFFASGLINVVMGVLLLVFFKDPGLGASEPELAGLSREEREAGTKLTWAKLKELMRIRTFLLMLGHRLLSSHLLINSFGVLFLVDVYGYSNAHAAVILLPLGIGFFLGTWIGGEITDRVQMRSPRVGRIALLQIAQLAYAVVVFFGTQFDWGSLAAFSAVYAVFGFLQGVNPGMNRPIVMAVTPPELRGPAFAVMLSIVQAITWAAYALGAGYLADVIGLRAVFLWLLVGITLVNGAFITLIYRPYVRDCAAMQQEMARRGEQPQA